MGLHYISRHVRDEWMPLDSRKSSLHLALRDGRVAARMLFKHGADSITSRFTSGIVDVDRLLIEHSTER